MVMRAPSDGRLSFPLLLIRAFFVSLSLSLSLHAQIEVEGQEAVGHSQLILEAADFFEAVDGRVELIHDVFDMLGASGQNNLRSKEWSAVWGVDERPDPPWNLDPRGL